MTKLNSGQQINNQAKNTNSCMDPLAIIKREQQLYRNDAKQENYITRNQREYRNFANGKYAVKEDKNERRNLLTNLEKMHSEHLNLQTTLKVAFGKTHCQSYNENMKKLEIHVRLQEQLDNDIKCLKKYNIDIQTQIKRVECQMAIEMKAAKTDLQHHQNLHEARKTKENLENNLQNLRKHESILITDNRKLNSLILHMMCERKLFDKLWKVQIKQLSYNKKRLIDMVERAVLAFNQGADLCEKLNGLNEEGKRDEYQHGQEMIDILRTLDTDLKMHQFLGVKGYRRQLTDLEPREYKRRQLYKDSHNCKLNLYKTILDDVKLNYSNVDNIEQAMELFENENNNYFAHFNYMNDLNNQMEFLNKSLKRLYSDIDHYQLANVNETLATEQSIQSLNEQLENEKKHTIDLDKKYEKDNDELQKLLKMINDIFKLIKCDDSNLKLLLGDYKQITTLNIMDYLPILEKRLVQILIYVYYVERKDLIGIKDDARANNKQFTVTKLQTVNRNIPTAIQDIVLVQQCSECAESGDVNRYDEEIVLPLDRSDIHNKTCAKIQAPTMQYRLHNLSKCKLPKSRALVNKRYQ